MARLIDADVLIEHLNRCIEGNKGLFRAVCVAIKCFVEQMKTVDAVEVVRCNDCADNMTGHIESGTVWCDRYCARRPIDGYCYQGKPKEGADNG